MNQNSALQFYQSHGEWSDPAAHTKLFDGVRPSVEAVVSAVRGVFLHDYFGAHLYANPPLGIKNASRETLSIGQRLPQIYEIDAVPLMQARDTSHRTVGTCRDYALMTCAMLRHHGIAARLRCGFARYFHPPTFEDHWICEYWDKTAERWKLVDAQLDAEHRRHLAISFDPLNVPREEFLFPWQVWSQHGHHPSALEGYGHGEAKGFWFVRVSLARDLLALCKCEVSPWDSWRDHAAVDKIPNKKAMGLCDAMALTAKRLGREGPVDKDELHDVLTSLETPHWQA